MFSLKQKNEENKVTYQKPGIYDNVVITDIILGKSSWKGSPFIQMNTKNENGDVGRSSKMYLNTVPSEGKEKSAWDVTSKNIIELVVATNNISNKEAEEIQLVTTQSESQDAQYEDLVKNLKNLLLNKPFRGKFKGEQTKENGLIYSSLDKAESMNVPKLTSSLRFDETKDIKLFQPVTETTVDFS